MASVDIPSVTFDGDNVGEVQAFLRERGSDATAGFDSTGLTCMVRTPEDGYPLIPGDVIIEDTAGSVFVLPRQTLRSS